MWWDSGDNEKRSPPDILLLQFILFTSFGCVASVQSMQLLHINPMTYITLSLTAKTLLCWLIAARVFV
eukprot:169176-Hanusia_phi.AAC.1